MRVLKGEPSQRPAIPATTHVRTSALAELKCILDPGINVCVLERRFSPAQQRALAALCGREPFERGVHAARGDRPGARLMQALSDAPAKPPGDLDFGIVGDVDANAAGLVAGAVTTETHAQAQRLLRQEIDRWTEIYLSLVPCAVADVSLELVANDACRKFHRDNVGVRLLCTFFGPGTEWAPRDALPFPDLPDEETPRNRQGILVHADRLERAQAGDVVLLKGKRWPGNARNGAVHRSPPVEALGLTRLVLRIDACSE